jgi:putative hydrolase of the HAD superfamily
MSSKIEAVLFDLGGVLERVVAAPQVEEWTRGQIPSDEFWHRWLSAESVRLYETGKIGTLEFCEHVVDELEIRVSPQEFKYGFLTWLAGPYDGAAELVQAVRGAGYKVASFSNSNESHWPIMERHQDTATIFDANFPSHQLAICKPDREAFVEVAKRWGIAPASILFLDDNEVNCDGARATGMQAERVLEVAGARTALVRRGILK